VGGISPPPPRCRRGVARGRHLAALVCEADELRTVSRVRRLRIVLLAVGLAGLAAATAASSGRDRDDPVPISLAAAISATGEQARRAGGVVVDVGGVEVAASLEESVARISTPDGEMWVVGAVVYLPSSLLTDQEREQAGDADYVALDLSEAAAMGAVPAANAASVARAEALQAVVLGLHAGMFTEQGPWENEPGRYLVQVDLRMMLDIFVEKFGLVRESAILALMDADEFWTVGVEAGRVVTLNTGELDLRIIGFESVEFDPDDHEVVAIVESS
jgi:hypothetical protein